MASKNQKSNAKRQIDDNLKRVYEDALSEDLPQSFLDLIEKLKKAEGSENDK